MTFRETEIIPYRHRLGILSTEPSTEIVQCSYIHSTEIVEEHFFTYIFSLLSIECIRRMTNEGFLLDLLTVVREPNDERYQRERERF